MAELRVETTRSSGAVILTVVGSLDETTLPQAEATLSRVVEESKEGVILNLYECEYIDDAAISRLVEFAQGLRNLARPYDVYVRPMSFVAYRTQTLPQVERVPEAIIKAGEERLAARRAKRLERWRSERPIPSTPPPGVPSAQRPGSQPGSGAFNDQVEIDFKRVSLLADKDERVVARIWETYCQHLNENRFETAPEGTADAQLNMDSRMVAHHLRLDAKVVRKVVESVSTYLMEALGPD